MRFTVLGKSPAWADAGGACSSYLVEQDGFRLLVDCGNGSFGKLRERVHYSEIDDIVISHLHGDHISDLTPFGYALTVGPGAGRPDSPRPRLWLPPGQSGELRERLGGGEDLIGKAFDVREYEPNGRLELGPLEIAMHEVPHFVLTHAVEITAPGGGRAVYGADCRACPELERAAAGAELLLAESTLPEPEPDSVPIADRGHMSAAEAAEIAELAGVGRLVLTHISDELDGDAALAAARERFAGPVEIAAEGSRWEVGKRVDRPL